MIPVKCPKCGETLTMFHNVSTTLEEAICPACGASCIKYVTPENKELKMQAAAQIASAILIKQPYYAYDPKWLEERTMAIVDSLYNRIYGNTQE